MWVHFYHFLPTLNFVYIRYLFVGYLFLHWTVRYGIFNMSQSSNTKNHLANDFFNFCGGSFFQFSRHRFALFVAESFSCFCVEVKNVTLSSFFRSPYALNWYFFTKICSLFSNDYIKLKLFSRTIILFIGFLILRNVTYVVIFF